MSVKVVALLGLLLIPACSESRVLDAPPPRCRNEQLTLALDSRSESLMHQTTFFLTLTNTGRSFCSLNGHPGVQLVAQDGRDVAQNVARGGNNTVQDPPNRDVTLADGAKAWFALATRPTCGPETKPAETTSALMVIPPDETRQLRVEAKVFYCADEPVVRVTSVQRARDVFGRMRALEE